MTPASPAPQPWKAKPSDLSARDRVEYLRLTEERALEYTKREVVLVSLAFAGLFVPIGVTALVAASTGEWTGARVNTWLVVAAVISGVWFFGTMIYAAVSQTRRRRHARAGMQALLAAVPPPAQRQSRGYDHDGSDWGRYPVTGTYNPELYRERGGRATAQGMATWGIDDYDTYRSNIE